MKNVSQSILFKAVLYCVLCIPTSVSYSATSQKYYEKRPYKEFKTLMADNSFQQLVRAIAANNIVRLRSLVQKSFNQQSSTQVDCYNNTLLHYAAAFADFDTFVFVLEYYQYHKDTTNTFGYTPLMIAQEYQNREAVKLLEPLTKYYSNACSSSTRFEFNYNLQNRVHDRVNSESAQQHRDLYKSLLLAALTGIAFGSLAAWLMNLNNHDI